MKELSTINAISIVISVIAIVISLLVLINDLN